MTDESHGSPSMTSTIQTLIYECCVSNLDIDLKNDKKL
jgi:hypothetical protein